jgi:hypothetical protein
VLVGSEAAGLPLTNGVASFTGLTIDRAGRRYQMQFSLGSLAPARTRSFTLGPALQILGTASMCPGTSSTFSTEASYDEYSWTLTPEVAPPAATHTPTVTLRNPPVTGEHTLGVSARVDGCPRRRPGRCSAARSSRRPEIDGYGTVCVDCIGGPSGRSTRWRRSRAVGYRTVSGPAP